MTDIVCCPLSGEGADGGPEFSNTSIVTARKEHKCYECGEVIPKGSRYERITGKWEGEMSTFRTCLICQEIRDHFACEEGFIFGELWSQLSDNFFPEMKAGGPCMEGLSPAAKDKLFAARLEWLGFNDDG